MIRRSTERSISLTGKGHQVHGGLGYPTHGIDAAEGLGGGDPAEGVRVVHHRCKEIHRLDERQILADPVYAGVIGVLQAHHDVFAGGKIEAAESFVQIPWRQLGGSAEAGYRLCRLNFF